jgi:hypothetical protein
MSDGMPGAVSKGKVLAELEELLNHPQDREELRKALEACDGTAQDSVADALESVGFPKRIAQHLREHLFPDQPPGYFPSFPNKNGICREGLLKAIDLAKGTPPAHIDCYWICSGSYFQLVATQGKSQVNLFFLTPPPPANLIQLPSSLPEDIYLIVDHYEAYEIVEVGSYPVLDASAPNGSRPPKANEIPEVSDTKTKEVKQVRVRRAP